ncbi:nuclear transport factor 2 family protein [Pedobacter rhizosphaerae]|uniref:SnoaL-like domain n=1 Tax=Pedobacter rhizosphaerae TaxID=390241 RepID=A0A1H9K1P3_9SPHI|nr:nuclear transport factor 2 family protein [Pedobacter rhizosphaerae]SEQ92999.1 SnoaL-like domain [Pedobacter rhizosphaerae]
MNLPEVIKNLIKAQNAHNPEDYAACFAETAVVHDEGKTHRGKVEIRQWNQHSNQEYQTSLKPQDYDQTKRGDLLTAEVSGDFPGSPAILKFHLTLDNNLISSLKITG